MEMPLSPDDLVWVQPHCAEHLPQGPCSGTRYSARHRVSIAKRLAGAPDPEGQASGKRWRNASGTLAFLRAW